MAKDKVKLSYFEGRGRGEVSRLIMAAAGAEYENHRVSNDEMAKIKPSLPFGQLPVMEYNGIQVAQSMAIARFLAKKNGLAGNNEIEDAQIDMIADHVQDHFASFRAIFTAKTDEDKKAAADDMIKVQVPKWLQQAEDLLKNAGGKYFVGNRLTWADIAIYDRTAAIINPTDPFLTKMMKILDVPERLHMLDNCPMLKAHIDRVASNPGIKKWLSERPSDEAERF